MVDVDDDRLKGLDKGARCVSFSSNIYEYFAVSKGTSQQSTHSW